MSTIDILKNYVDILEKDPNSLTSSEYETLISVRSNASLSNIVNEINNLPTKEGKLQAISRYEAELAFEKQNELDKIKDACQKEFGISLDQIEYKRLSSGKDIIAFYDPRLGRKRLIDYSYAKSLASEFTDVQNSNEMFQTDDSNRNAINIAKAEADVNRELKMLDIEQIKANYDEVIKQIPEGDNYKIDAINKLISMAESRNLKYINFENMVAIDSQGNIVEAALSQDNEVEVGAVSEYRNDSIEDNNLDNADDEYLYVNQDLVTDDKDFRKVIKEEMEIRGIKGSADEIYNKVQEYSKDMSKLAGDYENKTLNNDSYDFYKTLTDEYIKSNSLTRIQSRNLTYSPQSGYTMVFIIAYIVIFIAIVVSIILINR